MGHTTQGNPVSQLMSDGSLEGEATQVLVTNLPRVAIGPGGQTANTVGGKPRTVEAVPLVHIKHHLPDRTAATGGSSDVIMVDDEYSMPIVVQLPLPNSGSKSNHYLCRLCPRTAGELVPLLSLDHLLSW